MAVVAAVSMGLAACSSPDSQTPATGDGGFVGLRGSAAPTLLQADQSCDEVLEDFQSFAPDVLRDSFGVARDGDGFTTTAVALESTAGEATDDAAAAAPDEAFSDTAAASGSTSDTNTQEEGIDEPDVVETDGDFVYLVDQDQLVILEGATAQVVSRTQLAGHGAQLLLSGNRLLAITGGGYGIAFGGEAVPDIAPSRPADDVGTVEPLPEDAGTGDTPATTATSTTIAPDEPASGGTDAAEPPPPDDVVQPVEPNEDPIPVEPLPMPTEPPSFSAGTVIQLIDVSDRSAPTTLQTTEVEGHHVSTRVVDGVARVVISSYPEMVAFETMPMIDDGGFRDDGFDQGEFDDAVAEELATTDVDDWLPSFRTATAAGATSIEGSLVSCEQVLVPEVNAGVAETSILRVDFEDGFDPADTTTIVAEAGTVYASASTLYLAATRYVTAGERDQVSPEDWATAIHAFDLRGDGAATHLGAGEVPGNTLNQYSLSEHDGYLRIATTEGTPWGGSGDSESAVRVLHLDGGELVEVGMVGGLGKTETIQSVRFMGPVGYVVTFRQTDPLYVIDLSDPNQPAAVGELKIPGFSSYLHPVGEGRLVGVGRDADLEGVDQGFLVSLFDVSDPTDPKQLQTFTESEAYSAAEDDPKAFLWWAPESAAVLPLERYGPPAQGGPGGFQTGMTVLDIDDAGITERAIITAEGRYASRALVVQDRLWSLFDGGVVTSDFDGGSSTFHPFR